MNTRSTIQGPKFKCWSYDALHAYCILFIAGLRIEALEVEQKEEEKEDSTNEQTISDSEEDAKFVVSDDEAIDQPSDFEVHMNKS